MAREVRNADRIGKTGLYLEETAEKLVSIKSFFKGQINDVLANYQGVDATAIANVLSNAINKVDGLIKALNYYSEYMKSVANYDIQNIERASEQLKEKNKNKINNLEGVNGNEFQQFKY